MGLFLAEPNASSSLITFVELVEANVASANECTISGSEVKQVMAKMFLEPIMMNRVIGHLSISM